MTAVASPAHARPILCDTVIANVSSGVAARFDGKCADPLPLTWLDCTRRAFRKVTTGGRTIAILLPLGLTLSHGDVLHENETLFVVVNLLPCDLWLITSPDGAALMCVALELGNLHVPVEVTSDGALLTPPDGPAEGVLRRNGIPFTPCHRQFSPLRATVSSGLSLIKAQALVRSGMESRCK